MKKSADAHSNRLTRLAERSCNPRNMMSMSGKISATNQSLIQGEEESSRLIEGNARQRAYSSTGRSCWQIKRERENSELKEMHFTLSKTEQKHLEATERRQMQIAGVQTKISSLQDSVIRKREYVAKQQQEKFEKMFETNYLHRKKIEDAKKKKESERAELFEFDQSKKQEKLMMVKGRQKDLSRRLAIDHAELNKEWNEIRNRPATFADGNLSFYNQMATRLEQDARRRWLQKEELSRKTRQQQEYKALLIDKMHQKDSHVAALAQRKNQMVEYGRREAYTLQDNFFRTTRINQNGLLPQPFEKHKKEFDSMKEVKPEIKLDD